MIRAGDVPGLDPALKTVQHRPPARPNIQARGGAGGEDIHIHRFHYPFNRKLLLCSNMYFS